jgi:restriction system protein
MGCTPDFFEKLVVDLLVAMGYGGSRKDAGEAVGRSGDGGIDGIIKEDKLGLDAVYIQAKRWEGTVGRPMVQAFAGSLMGNRAGKGVMITTSQFSKDANDYVRTIQQPKIVLIGGEQLAQFMIDHDIGVADVATYRVKKVDLERSELPVSRSFCGDKLPDQFRAQGRRFASVERGRYLVDVQADRPGGDHLDNVPNVPGG